MVTGKGGSGKTFLSALLAIRAAEEGKKVLLVENNRCGQIQPLFGKPSKLNKEEFLYDNIWGINLEVEHCLREYIENYLGLKKLYDTVFMHPVIRSFFQVIPGLGDSMLLGRMFYSCELEKPSKYDLVIFDAPASGHFSQLLSMPSLVMHSGLGGPIVKELTKVHNFLSSPSKTGIIVTCLPESLVVSETLDLISLIHNKIDTKIAAVFINQEIVTDIFPKNQTFDGNFHSSNDFVENYIYKKYSENIKESKKIRQRLKGFLEDGKLHTIPYLGVIKEPIDKSILNSI